MEVSLKEIVDLVKVQQPECPFTVGTQYLFRTVGYHWLGRVDRIIGKFVVLTEASWVSDTGRYSEALNGKIGELASSELEPSPRPVSLNIDHVTDAVEYPFVIPRGVK